MTDTTAQPKPLSAFERVEAIDIVRGFVIVLMALDHVRDFFHMGAFSFNALDPTVTTPAIYATRWITHLCAPTFVFLSGVSAYLQLARGKSTGALSRFLITRGLWLIVLELTVISFGWSFAFPYPPFLQVIWAIGWGMVALGLLVFLPRVAVLAIGLAIVFGHNLLDPITPETFGGPPLLWTLLHDGGLLFVGETPIGLAAYPIVPWIGIMAAGYGLGAIFIEPAAKRDRTLLIMGSAMLALFVVLRLTNFYGNETRFLAEADIGANIMRFLDVEKYPPSLLYTLVTLGVIFVSFPLFARLKGIPAKVLLTFGSVPFFFYILHVYLIHALAWLANTLTGRDASGMFGFLLNQFTAPDSIAHLGFPFPLTFAFWILVLALLYFPCRYWSALKKRRRDWWLSYL